MYKLVLILTLLNSAAQAHDPFNDITRRDPDGSLHKCCNGGEGGDCFQTDIRQGVSGLEAFVPGQRNFGLDMWVLIPKEMILPIDVNPVVGPVICWNFYSGVLCFMPGRDF